MLVDAPSSAKSPNHRYIRIPSSDPSDVRAQADRGDDDDSLNEIIMALDFKDRGTLGCCYYVAFEESLYVMQDVKSGGPEMVDTCSRLSKNRDCYPY